MKTLLLPALLLLAACTRPLTNKRAEGTYIIQGTARGYQHLADTASLPGTPAPVVLESGTSITQVTHVDRKWSSFSCNGKHYYAQRRYIYQASGTNPGSSSSYDSTPTGGQSIQTGPRGGRYYINSNGNKTYIKR